VGHTGTVWSIHLSSHHVFTGSDDWTAKQYSMSTGECIRTFEGHDGSVMSLCTVCMDMEGIFSEGLLCTGSEDGSIRLWRVGPKEMQGGDCVGMSCGEAAAKEGKRITAEQMKHDTHFGSSLDLDASTSDHHARQAGVHKWEWDGSIHTVAANNMGIIYSGSAAGIICEYDLNDKAWVELPPEEMGVGAPLWLQRTNSWKSEGGAIMGMVVNDEGYLHAACEDCTAHEFWVSRKTKGTVKAPVKKAVKQKPEPPKPKIRRVDSSQHRKATPPPQVRHVQPEDIPETRNAPAFGPAASTADFHISTRAFNRISQVYEQERAAANQHAVEAENERAASDAGSMRSASPRSPSVWSGSGSEAARDEAPVKSRPSRYQQATDPRNHIVPDQDHRTKSEFERTHTKLEMDRDYRILHERLLRETQRI